MNHPALCTGLLCFITSSQATLDDQHSVQSNQWWWEGL